MATGKTGIKKVKAGVQSDTNVKAMTMGNGWSTRAMRNSAGSRSGSGSRAKRMFKVPPPGGWVAGAGGNC